MKLSLPFASLLVLGAGVQAVPMQWPFLSPFKTALEATTSSSPFLSPFLTSLSSLAVPSLEDFAWLAEKRLVQISHDEPPRWMTEAEKMWRRYGGQTFMDVTDHPHLGLLTNSLKSGSGDDGAWPKLSHQEVVQPILANLSTAGPRKNLAKFSSFRTRYYRSAEGRQSSLWLRALLTDLVASFNRTDVVVEPFEHRWGQDSIIVHIPGAGDEALVKEKGVVIVGAHQDSTNLIPFLGAPGADDDGSGTVTAVEALRGLLAHDFRPTLPVEFMFFSAEEGGLLGSQAIAAHYEQTGKKVRAMMEQDMTAWVKKGTREEVGIVNDFADAGLTKWLKTVVDEYLDIPWVDTKCGYACSDYASWQKIGSPSCFAIESQFGNSNPNIHSTKDRIDISDEFSFDHMLQFSRLSVGFVIELAGWKK